ncbi:g3687 [Coccomyxa elongata]
MHRPGDASEEVLGPGTDNNLLTELDGHDVAEDFWSTWNSLDSMPWLEEDIDMPLACLETLQWAPALDSWTDEDPGSEFTHLSERTRGLDSLNLDDIACLDDAAASQACSRPCTVAHSFTTQWSVTGSPARQPQACPGPASAAEQALIAPAQACAAGGVAHHQQPAAAVSATDPAPPACVSASGIAPQGNTVNTVTPAHTFQPPAWVEPGYMGGAQLAAAGWVAPAAAKEPQHALVRRNRAGAEPDQAPAQPHVVAAPNRAPPVLPEPVTDLAPHQLAQHMPRLPAERAITNRARCCAQHKRAKLAVRDASASVLLAEKEALEGQVVALLDHHEQLSLDLPVRMQHEEASFTASMISCLAAAGPAMPPTPSTKPLMAPIQNLRRAPSLEAGPEQCGNRGILWSTIVTFLKLSKPQKDNLAAAYIAHVQWVDALRSQCLSDTAPFQISEQLTGTAMQEQDIVQSLTNSCHQVLDKVQLDNLHALAPAGTPAALALCRELAGPSSRAPPPSVGTTAGANATVPNQRRQAARSRQAALGTQAGAPAGPANTRVLAAGRAVGRKRQTPDLPKNAAKGRPTSTGS